MTIYCYSCSLWVLVFWLISDNKICRSFSKKIFHEHYLIVKQLRSRAGLTFCQSWSGSKLLAKINSRQQKPWYDWKIVKMEPKPNKHILYLVLEISWKSSLKFYEKFLNFYFFKTVCSIFLCSLKSLLRFNHSRLSGPPFHFSWRVLEIVFLKKLSKQRFCFPWKILWMLHNFTVLSFLFSGLFQIIDIYDLLKFSTFVCQEICAYLNIYCFDITSVPEKSKTNGQNAN